MNLDNKFLDQNNIEIANEFLERGYIINEIKDIESLKFISNLFIFELNNVIKTSEKLSQKLLNSLHEYIEIENLNNIRIDLLNRLNKNKDFKLAYFNIARDALSVIVGNELVMQKNINLSIQFPNDSSSLLETHADTWSGDSPYEVVVWFPLVDCYKTKSMYILSPEKSKELNENFSDYAGNTSDQLFEAISRDVEFIKINYGQFMIFNQSLPHGNRVNLESETRISMNCRFKSLFSPYNDKKLGEFFIPITIKPATINGLNYSLPGDFSEET